MVVRTGKLCANASPIEIPKFSLLLGNKKQFADKKILIFFPCCKLGQKFLHDHLN